MSDKERNSCLQNHDYSAEDENNTIIHSLSTEGQERIKQTGKLKTALQKRFFIQLWKWLPQELVNSKVLQQIKNWFWGKKDQIYQEILNAQYSKSPE